MIKQFLEHWNHGTRDAHAFYVFSQVFRIQNHYLQKTEDIYFFEVNTQYILLSVMKTSEFSGVCIYLVFTKKKVNFLFILHFFHKING